jgi:peroxiredoxin
MSANSPAALHVQSAPLTARLRAGDTFPTLDLVNIQKTRVVVPDAEGRWTHLQFRRYAGCPVCNLHLQSVIRRHKEIVGAGVREVVVFHSSDKALLPFQGSFPFDVIGDPKKVLYRRFGVTPSLLSLLNPRAWPGIVRGNLLRNKPGGLAENGHFGRPAEFLISPQGLITHAHYGVHAFDQWSVDELLMHRAATAGRLAAN